MAEALIVGLIVAVFSSVTAPLFIIFLGDRARRQERKANWDRQDALAAAAARAEKLAQTTNGKLDIIHRLVNSGLTRVIEAERIATMRELAARQEVIDLRRSLGQEPSAEAEAVISSIRDRLAELEATLDERRRADEITSRHWPPPPEESDPQ